MEMESPEMPSNIEPSSANTHREREVDNADQAQSTSKEIYEDSKQSTTIENIEELQEVVANFEKPNVPNVNVPEYIIICLDICYDHDNSMYRLGDGTSFTCFNMLKRVLDFFIHSKYAINKKTHFALMILKDEDVSWVQNFTNSPKEIINKIDYINAEPSSKETFNFSRVFEVLKERVEIPESKEGGCILPPPYVVRMVVLYGRSNCVPNVQEDPYMKMLKKQLYFYIDILLAHEDDCSSYKCEEIYDALQDLDNGYSYVFEVPRNATKIHDYIAKLLAHPLQRPLQKNTNYSFGSLHFTYEKPLL